MSKNINDLKSHDFKLKFKLSMTTAPVTSYSFEAIDSSTCRIKHVVNDGDNNGDDVDERKYIEDVKNLTANDVLFYYNHKLEEEHRTNVEKLEKGASLLLLLLPSSSSSS
jgi:hypothetical protein